MKKRNTGIICTPSALVGLLVCLLTGSTAMAQGYGWPNPEQKREVTATPVRAQSTAVTSRASTPATGGPGYSVSRPVVVQQCGCAGRCNGGCTSEYGGSGFYRGVDSTALQNCDNTPTWDDEQSIPWEAFAFGEYMGPHRTPHLPRYRARVNDQIEFVYQLTREQSFQPYRLSVGDRIRISSELAGEDVNQGGDTGLLILSDGSVSFDLIGRVIVARKTIQELQDELNERYGEYFAEGTDPAIVVSGISTDTRLQDLINSVDARAGSGGQSRLAKVSPDGTVQLPMIGSIPAVGLTLEELGREVNMRYRQQIQGVEVTPILETRAQSFIYVLGEVAQPGQVELSGPTTAIQSIAQAGGWNPGGNLRQIVVFRRDQNWGLMALRLDLAGGLHGKHPLPTDDIWLRDSDIVLVPKLPIQRIADAIDLYFTRSLYALFPSEFGTFDGQSSFR